MNCAQVVRLRGRRLTVLLVAGRICAVCTDAKQPAPHITADRLETTGDVEGLSNDGRTLRVGAWGVLTLVSHMAALPAYSTSRGLMRRLSHLFAGSPYFEAVLRGTVRAGLDLPAEGEAGYWKRCAMDQMEPFTIRDQDGPRRSLLH